MIFKVYYDAGGESLNEFVTEGFRCAKPKVHPTRSQVCDPRIRISKWFRIRILNNGNGHIFGWYANYVLVFVQPNIILRANIGQWIMSNNNKLYGFPMHRETKNSHSMGIPG